jgi:hypothetical protein
MTAPSSLTALDNYKWGYYCQFIDLGHPYSYLIDCRLNIFAGDDKWAIVAEKLGYNPRAGRIILQVSYFGNCLRNLERYNNQDTNYYIVYPIDDDQFFDTTDGEWLTTGAHSWRVRGQEVELGRQKEDYAAVRIEPKTYRPDDISVEEAARWLVPQHRDLFRATDVELYKSLPAGLPKILTLDEWYHRDYNDIPMEPMSDERLRSVYEFNRRLTQNQHQDQPYMDFDTFSNLYRAQQQRNGDFNQDQYDTNRPSAYETWRLLAEVIATGNPAAYQPTMAPNTHWTFWPDSGSMWPTRDHVPRRKRHLLANGGCARRPALGPGRATHR